LPSGYWSQW